MSAAYSLPRRPLRTRQDRLVYSGPIVFSRHTLRSGCIRTIVGYPATSDLAPAVRLAVELADRTRIGTVTLYGSELLEMGERALEAARQGRPGEIGVAASGRTWLRIWVHQYADTVALYIMRVRPDGKSISRPMRVEPAEYDAFERALSWLRNETT